MSCSRLLSRQPHTSHHFFYLVFGLTMLVIHLDVRIYLWGECASWRKFEVSSFWQDNINYSASLYFKFGVAAEGFLVLDTVTFRSGPYHGMHPHMQMAAMEQEMIEGIAYAEHYCYLEN